MALNNEQQNLVNDLRAPVKSFRIFALEETIKNGASEEVLQVLQELKSQEEDDECLVLFNYAISAVQERIGQVAGHNSNEIRKFKEEHEFNQLWKDADDNGKMQILSQLPGRLPPGLKEIGPSLLVTESSAVISARIIRIFCRSWPEDKFFMISNALSSPSLSLRLASLRTIVHMKPELLLNQLPVLLNSEDPQIKALAIRGLAKIDKEEALNHLQALLLSSSLSDRLAGIQNCPFLPFDMVKPLLLKYFAAENHPDLLIRAGWILEMNPDVQVPFKLFEIAERSPAKKAELVKKILNDAVKILEKSGILGSEFNQFMRKLQDWVKKRNALRFVQKIAQRLEFEEIPADIDQLMRSRLTQSLVRESVQEALQWPVSETVKSRLAAYLKSSEPQNVQPLVEQGPATQVPTPSNNDSASALSDLPEPNAEAEKPAEKSKEPSQEAKSDTSVRNVSEERTVSAAAEIDFKAMSAGQLIKFLSQLEYERLDSLIDQLLELAQNRNCQPQIRIAVLQCFAVHKKPGAESLAEKLVAGNVPEIVTAALEYLGEVDPERVFPYLGQCLKMHDIGTKSAALGILRHFDFNQAVSALNGMLQSRDPEQQRMALKCMEQFDFSLIREKLTEYLEKCRDENLAEAGLCHFAANPGAENMYSLYKIEQAHSGKIASYAKRLREASSAALSESIGGVSIGQSTEANEDENILHQRYQNEQTKRKQVRPAYAYRENISKTASVKENVEELLSAAKDLFTAKGSYVTLIILVILGVGFYNLFMPGAAPDPSAGRGSAVITGQYLREGTVSKISGTAVEFTSREGEKFVFHPPREGYRMPRLNAMLRVSLVPYRKDPNGIFLSRIRALREISKFSAGGQEKAQ